MNITQFHNITNYNNETNDEKPHIFEVIVYVSITLLMIILIFCCYIKSNDYIDDEARVYRSKTRLTYRYGEGNNV